jgi:hypothetical protein
LILSFAELAWVLPPTTATISISEEILTTLYVKENLSPRRIRRRGGLFVRRTEVRARIRTLELCGVLHADTKERPGYVSQPASQPATDLTGG